MDNTSASNGANERSPVSHFVLYADGQPVFSSDDVSELDAFKQTHIARALNSGRPFPKFHKVERQIHDGEDKSHDVIIEGDKENAPSGLTKIRGL